MLSMTIRLTTMTALCLTLAACGGGSSDDSSPPAFSDTNGGTAVIPGPDGTGGGDTTPSPDAEPPKTGFLGFSRIAKTGEETLDGKTVGTSYILNPVTRRVSLVGGVRTSDKSKGKLTTKDGDIVALGSEDSTNSVEFDTRTGATIEHRGVTQLAESEDGRDFAVIIDPESAEYEYQTFGSWVTGYGRPNGTFGAGSYGARTPAADMPRNQKASYRGASSGVARGPDGEGYLTVSTVTVETDFRSVDIESRDTRAINLNSAGRYSARSLDFKGTGQVSGSSFTANVSGTGSAGTANGQFYGPNAEEVGGTFHTRGSGGVEYIGAFGAN